MPPNGPEDPAEGDDRPDESPSEALLRSAREGLAQRSVYDTEPITGADERDRNPERHLSEPGARNLDRHLDARIDDELDALDARLDRQLEALDSDVTAPTAPEAMLADMAGAGDATGPGDTTGAASDTGQGPIPYSGQNVRQSAAPPIEPGSAGGPVVPQSGKTVASVILAAAAVILIALAVIVVIAVIDQSGTPASSLSSGDCLDAPESGQIVSVDLIPCEEPHTFEVIGSVILGDGPFPGDSATIQTARESCEDIFPGYVGEPVETSSWYINAFVPTREGWDDGDRSATCLIFKFDDDLELEELTGSARDAGASG